MTQIFRYTLLGLLLTFTGTGFAGEMSASLFDQLQSASPTDRIDVWIRPVQAESKGDMITAATADKSTREARFVALQSKLAETHARSQQWLVEELRTLADRGAAEAVKPHWLVNIVEAKLTVTEIERLAGDPRVEKIYPRLRLTTIVPEFERMAPPMATDAHAVQSNLIAINADLAWAAGYTGAGRLVCSFDTGVEGGHPALSHSWRGNDGNHEAAWFFPRSGEGTTPEVVEDCRIPSGCNENHGTHTLGIMVGRDDATGDTTGVAPDAEWISAAVIDIAGTTIIDAFEWAANPDGDFNTVSDVPDVINHSWGVREIGCEDLFFDLIDYTEGLGIVNIFAAGNQGVGAGGTIVNPANRALDSLDCFAVGNIRTTVNPPAIYASSSRGPSDCNGATKPNVVAPGYAIRSTYPTSTYAEITGTSMAAPHVSGLVALIREKNPNASVNEIKEAILTSTNTTVSGSPSFPNNDYGWGMIDCLAALNKISAGNSDPNIRVFSFADGPINPGDTVTGFLALQNVGDDAIDISATLTSSFGEVTVLNGSAYFGNLSEGQIDTTGNQFRIVVSESAQVGELFALDLNVSGGGYDNDTKLFVQIEPISSRSFVTHNSGRIEFSVSGFGTMGMGSGSFFPAGGEGFKFDAGSNELYEAGLLLGTGPLQVSDGVRNTAGEPDGDFDVVSGGTISLSQPGDLAVQQTWAAFDDSRGVEPLGVELIQETYGWSSSPNDDFIILRYILENTNQFAGISNLYFGLYMDWDVIDYTSNSGGWDAASEVLWTAYNNTVTYSDYRGAMVLEGGIGSAYTSPGTLVSFNDDGFTESEKFTALSNGTVTADSYKLVRNDLVQLIAAAPFGLAAGQKDTIAFALVGADDLAGIADVATRAAAAYNVIATDVVEEGPAALPQQYVLLQNYPNPFNPSTVISFELPRKSEYELIIYNIAGQEVERFSGTESAGRVHVEWDASRFASGVYLYQLRTESFSQSRKMTLLK